jgi:hypothetical protein
MRESEDHMEFKKGEHGPITAQARIKRTNAAVASWAMSRPFAMKVAADSSLVCMIHTLTRS